MNKSKQTSASKYTSDIGLVSWLRLGVALTLLSLAGVLFDITKIGLEVRALSDRRADLQQAVAQATTVLHHLEVEYRSLAAEQEQQRASLDAVQTVELSMKVQSAKADYTAAAGALAKAKSQSEALEELSREQALKLVPRIAIALLLCLGVVLLRNRLTGLRV